MNFLKYNRTAAIAVMIAMILAAIPVGAIRSVSSLEKRVETVFRQGNDRYGTAQADLNRIADYGDNLLSIALALDCADPAFAPALSALRQSVQNPLSGEDVLSPVMQAASMSYNRIMALPAAPEAQRNSAISYFYEMDSTRARLRANEEYTRAAQKYNRALASFPASLFCAGKEEAPLFGN